MQALIGSILEVTPLVEATVAGRDGTRVEISFTAVCVLPERAVIPEWLKEQTLRMMREVDDPREVGHAGDSLVLTVAESARWLQPLAVTPVYYAALPARLDITLRWWKDEQPPEVMVSANGRQWRGKFTRVDDHFTAGVETSSFYPVPPPTLPVTFDITFDKLHLQSVVLPIDRPGGEKVLDERGERFRVRNAWYEMEMIAHTNGGGIAALCEVGRGNDHFRRRADLIQRPLDFAGHSDRLTFGWGTSKLDEVALSCTGLHREGPATRVLLEGPVDEGMGLRTTVSYTLFDELPLLLLQRDFALHGGKKTEGPEKPKAPVDEVTSAAMGFRAAFLPERNGDRGSRIFCVEGERLARYRSARAHNMITQMGWRLREGWAMVEHPQRREYMLYLFDKQSPPYLASWLGPYCLTLEPRWPHLPLLPGATCGFALALTAGEIGGAAVTGGWVGCRTRCADGVRCAVVGVFREGAEMTALFSLGAVTRLVPLASTLLAGVGTIHYAVLDVPAGSMTDDFSATVAGIAGRGHTDESL